MRGIGAVARILVVDDSTTIRRLLRDMLTTAGHQVVGEADTGVKAYTEYVRLKPDIVTMDLGMPTMNGLAAMSKILAPFPEARFLVISAMEQRQVIEEALERGARGFLLKPFTESQVKEAVSSIMKQPFNTAEFRERARRYRRSQKNESQADTAVVEVISPYNVERAPDGAIRVEINPHFSVGSCAALALETKFECQAACPGVRFDFGGTGRLERKALAALNRLMHELHQTCGGVTAVIPNDKMVRQIQDDHASDGQLKFLALLVDETQKI
ncbi:MAG: response regulator [Veillonellaceae bacterium]|jgi:DNA-binding NarL/FixJ family response regulator|nr:response regulator [Veillonellaceae bacterium]